jgi:L-ascorbate metabolism protein UlaG (beta-lactamase superfamily)
MPTGARVQWIGHATAVVEIGGEKVLIDPLGRRRCRQVEGYSAVLVTHSHVDHLNRWTLKSLDKGAKLLVPKGAGRVVSDLGFSEVREVEPGDQLAVGTMDIIAVPTKHDAGRWKKGDSPINAGFVVAKSGVQVHHAGDVDMSTYEVFEDIGREFDLDATLLPIGGMLPVWYYRLRREALDKGVHIDPDTALHIAERLGARTMVPVHWGTVNLRLGPPSMPARRLRKIAAESDLDHLIEVLAHGQALELGGPKELPAHEVLQQADAADAGQEQAHDHPE